MERFILSQRNDCDMNYRQRVCLKLVHSTDASRLAQAIEIGKRHGLSKWDVVMRHMQWLFERDEDDPKYTIETALKICEPLLLERPVKFAKKIQSDVLAVVKGTSHRRLGTLCGLLLRCISKIRRGEETVEDVSEAKKSDLSFSEKSMRSRLIAFYEKHNRSKVSAVDSLLKKHRDNLYALSAALAKRYTEWEHSKRSTPAEMLLQRSRLNERITKIHQILLRRVSQVAPRLDYKRMMGHDAGFNLFGFEAEPKDDDIARFERASLEAIVDVATNRNVGTLAKIVATLSREIPIASSLSPSKMFATYCSRVLSPCVTEAAYDRCRGYFRRLDTLQLLNMTRKIVFDDGISAAESRDALKASLEVGERAVDDCASLIEKREGGERAIALAEVEWIRRKRNAMCVCAFESENGKVSSTSLNHLLALGKCPITHLASTDDDVKSSHSTASREVMERMILVETPLHILRKIAASIFPMSDADVLASCFESILQFVRPRRLLLCRRSLLRTYSLFAAKEEMERHRPFKPPFLSSFSGSIFSKERTQNVSSRSQWSVTLSVHLMIPISPLRQLQLSALEVAHLPSLRSIAFVTASMRC